MELCAARLNTDPLPNIDKVFANALRKEQHHETVAEPNAQIEGAASFAKPMSRLTCDHCGKSGHKMKNGWSLHGKPGDKDGRLRGGKAGKGQGRGARIATANHSVTTDEEL